MITIQSLCKTYNTKKTNCVNALNNISLDLPDKGLVFILGKSGSGKTTLLNLLGGLDRPTSGEFIVEGMSSKTFKENDYDAYRNTYVGFIFQEYNLIDNYTVGQNIELSLELQAKKVDRESIDKVLIKLGLVDNNGETLYCRKTRDLSCGQKQRVAIARAIIKDPKLILADEPTGALDKNTSESLLELLKNISKEKLVIVVSHNQDDAKRYGDRVIELKDGSIIYDSDVLFNKKDNHSIVKFKSSRLPFKRAVIMGIEGLKTKPFRLIISIILSVISLTLFVFSLSASNANEVTSELKTAYKNGAKHIILSGVQNRESHIVYNNGTTVDGEGSYSCIFTPEQLKVLSKSSPVYTIVLSLSANSDKYGYLFDTYGYLDKSNITYSERLNPYNYFSDILFSSFVAIDSDTEPNDLSLKPVTKNSRLPKKIDELAITDYQAEMFMRFGYTDVRDDMIKTEISSPEDMIGKTINGLSIVGIYSTEESLEWLKQYDVDFTGTYSSNYTDGYYVNIDNYFYNWTQSDFHMIKTGFVSSEWSEIFDCTQVLYKLSGKISTDKKLINDISFDEVITYDGELTANTTKLYYIKNHYTATVATAYSGFTEAAWMFTNEIFLKATLYAGIGISLFSALLLMNFLLVLVDARKYEIGVLRVLGARKRDAVNICLVESMTVALVEYLLTLITGSLICLLINNYYNFYLFNLGVMPIVFLTILCFGIAVFATIIPILKILKKQPIKIVH